MVALVLLQAARVVALGLGNGDRLRGAGFAAAGVSRAGEHARGRTLGGAGVHGAQNLGQVLGPIAQIDRRRDKGCAALPARPGLDRQAQPGPVCDAGVGQRGHGARQLQHGKAVVTLTNTQRDGFADKPALLLRASKSTTLPGAAGQHAARFAHQVDAAELAKPQRQHKVVDRIDAHFVRQGVVVDVAGVDDAAPQIDAAQIFVAMAAKTVRAQHPKAGVIDLGCGAAQTQLQRRQAHEGLVGRARRVGAAQGAVEQRPVDRLVERAPALHVDAVDEQVGVEGGHADKGQHLAVARIDRHQGTAAGAKHLFDQSLQADVYRQNDVVARLRRCVGEHAHGASTGRGLDPLVPGHSVQHRFKALLDTRSADVIGAAVVGPHLLRPLGHALFVALVDAGDVAQHVAGRRAQRVVANQARAHLDAGKAKTLRRKACHFNFRQTAANRQRIKTVRLLQQPTKAPLIQGRDRQQLAQRGQGGIQVGHPRRRDL